MKALLHALRSEDKLHIRNGLEGLARRLPDLRDADFEEAVQAVIGLFYVDPADHPEMAPVLEQAEGILAEQGTRAFPAIFRSLQESDLKVHFHLAAALGRMGYDALEPLLAAYRQAQEPYLRIFALYALGKIRDARVIEALPVLFAALEDPNPELRDTAARAMGKVVEVTPPGSVPGRARAEMFVRLLARASDRFAGVRSKAIRSLGKMARFGLLQEEQRDLLSRLLSRALGEDDAENWDLAYIVRAEAEKARKYLG